MRLRNGLWGTAAAAAMFAVGLAAALYRGAGAGGAAFAGLAAALLLAGAAAFAVGRRAGRAVDAFERSAEAGDDVPGPAASTGIRELDRALAAGRALAGRRAEERRNADRQRREAGAALAAMAEGVVILDADGRVTEVNAAARRMLELGDAPFRGRLALEALRNAELDRLVRRARRSGEPVEADLDLPPPRDRSFEVRIAPLAPADGERPGALIVLHDVSRLRVLERVRRDFAANASHELRTPVTSIRGYAESLCELELSPPEAARFAATIARNAAQLQALIQDLLTLAEIESDHERGGTPAKEDLPLAVIFAAVEDTCGPAARARRIALTFRAAEGFRVRAVPALLERALVNLVENAIRYSEPGTAVEVTGTASADGGAVLAVRDQGVGIAPEHLGRIFERFYRVDRARSRRQGGTGLGLSIVRNAVEAQGGTVTAVSTLGAGSVFTITLPAG